ncbi:MAG: hypothetical protein ACK551_01430 [Vampirovibrionales bacterium]
MSINPNSLISTNPAFGLNLKARQLNLALYAQATPEQKLAFDASIDGSVRSILRDPNLTDKKKSRLALNTQLNRALILAPPPIESTLKPDSLISTDPKFRNSKKVRQVILGLYDHATPEQKLAFNNSTNGEVQAALTNPDWTPKRQSRTAVDIQLDRALNFLS